MTLSVISNSPTSVIFTSREIVVAMVKSLKKTESSLDFLKGKKEKINIRPR